MEDFLREIATDLTVAMIVWYLMRDTKNHLINEIRYYRGLTFRIQSALLSKLGVENAGDLFNPDDLPANQTSISIGGD